MSTTHVDIAKGVRAIVGARAEAHEFNLGCKRADSFKSVEAKTSVDHGLVHTGMNPGAATWQSAPTVATGTGNRGTVGPWTDTQWGGLG